MTRDAQRSKVYDAEQLVRTIFDRADEHGVRSLAVVGSQITLPIERRFASIESVQSYCDRVLELNWVQEQWPVRPITVRARAGHQAAHYEVETATLAVPLHVSGKAWALRELVVLHELAHHLEPAGEFAPHGPEFVDRYLDLIDEIVGGEAAFLMRTTMLDCGVRIG
ncbi:TIGR04338 family metallohydrolase [Antrihabitans cavernicola]|uniref:TIGR04338 family metallohydrolase n=1 Tax=Antrihabitans cavernicola TaxID=2495913 RepID=A0A5A7S2U3_9NOCA|nr:TIGR04338 family metallohydrolase [Spelaeibacter cavernicola]KAA0018463.1 TIGR04338 family metallohydrolase [Spelaeibacter cavernicola]